jgi:CheY-like chemotaxis protein
MSDPCILVVDDNPINLKLMADLLEFEGCRVLKAVDADDAQAVLEGDLPDLILMDIGLPGMDGLALTRHLKAQTRTAHLPIVALTSYAMKGDDEKARQAGCDGYITKPINTRTIAATVLKYIVRDEPSGPK